MAGGVEYRIRPIRGEDAERERAFIMNLSPESRFRRLMYTLREPSAEFVARLPESRPDSLPADGPLVV